MRDEEANVADAVASLDLQPELVEIIVVDDQSTDVTPAILAELAQRIPRLKIMRTDSLPAGWTGKNHAVAEGANAASPASRWLLFTDADTRHMPGSLAVALCTAEEKRAALVSFSPAQEMGTFWERALIPVVYCKLARRFQYDRINDAHLPDAAANGQYMLIRRDAYDAVGGQAAVRGCILEDLELARRIKSAGYPICFAPGQGIARTRMYCSFGAMWEGWTKNLYLLFGARGMRTLIPELLALALMFWGLAPVVKSFTRGRIGLSAICLAALIVAGVHARQAVLLRRNGYSLHLIKYYVPGLLLYDAALVVSWWRNTYGAVQWKGRVYPAGIGRE